MAGVQARALEADIQAAVTAEDYHKVVAHLTDSNLALCKQSGEKPQILALERSQPTDPVHLLCAQFGPCRLLN